MDNIPYGYCHCGCGKKTTLWKYSSVKDDATKGEPAKYISGHNLKEHPKKIDRTEAIEALRAENPVPYGCCWCGCGAKTTPYKATVASRGVFKGEPSRYLLGHQSLKSVRLIIVEDRGHDTPCWIWQRAKHPRGYGSLYKNNKHYPAHRYYYERIKGPVPEGLVLHHDCEVTSCVNPDHVRPVTQAENVRIGQLKRRRAPA